MSKTTINMNRFFRYGDALECKCDPGVQDVGIVISEGGQPFALCPHCSAAEALPPRIEGRAEREPLPSAEDVAKAVESLRWAQEAKVRGPSGAVKVIDPALLGGEDSVFISKSLHEKQMVAARVAWEIERNDYERKLMVLKGEVSLKDFLEALTDS